MKDLREDWEAFAARIGEARAVSLLLDFDGTLTPLIERPELAELSPAARRALKEAAACPRITLGIVSGRPLADLVKRTGMKGIWYVGNHGYEIRTPSGEERRFYEAQDVRVLQEVRAAFELEAGTIPGVLIEDKGPIIALHYRMVDEARVDEVQRAFLRIVDRYHRAVMLARGHRVLEARLRSHCNKGTAVRYLRRELSGATFFTYFGDDLTDRDAFRALKGLGISVQVGAADASLADYTLPDPGAVVEVLDLIVERLSKGRTRIRRLPRRHS